MQQKLIIYRLYSFYYLQSVIFCLESCVCCLWPANSPSTSVEDSLQINLFMQNKPNVKYAQFSVSPFITSKYVKMDIWWIGKINPIKPKTNPIYQKGKNELKHLSNNGL